MKSFRFIVDNIEELSSGASFAIMTIITFLNVISRYFFDVSFTWPEELSRYCFLWMTFLGAALCTKHGRHIVIDFLILKFSRRTRNFVLFAADISVILLMLCIAYYGWKYASYSTTATASLNIPMSYILYVVPCSALLIIKRTLEKAVGELKIIKRAV